MKNDTFIPVSEPLIGAKEEQYVLDCLRSGWISSEGKYIKEFENACANYCSMKNGIAVSNGTTALQVALKCLNLKKGDEVIMPAFTIISCAMAIVEAGATPVLVDADPELWTMNTNDIEAKITKKTKAIMVVHIYGHPVDLDPVIQLTKKYNLYLVEDTAEAFGAEYKGRLCGSFSDLSTHSFYANKLITTGEGGMVLTNNEEFAAKARSLRNLCFLPEKRFYHHEIGYNYRLTNMQAAVGLAQLERINEFVQLKRKMAKRYLENLKGLPLELPAERAWAKNVYWMFAVVIKDSVKLDAVEFSKLLLEKGIQTRPFFIGMHEQPVFNKMGLFTKDKHPICERISRKGFYVPSGHAITTEQIDYVSDTIKKIFNSPR